MGHPGKLRFQFNEFGQFYFLFTWRQYIWIEKCDGEPYCTEFHKYLVLLLTALQIEYFKVTYKLFILDIYGVEYDDYKVFFENISLHIRQISICHMSNFGGEGGP